MLIQAVKKVRPRTKSPPKGMGDFSVQKSDSVGKPSSVAYDHLSSRIVANAVKPPFTGRAEQTRFPPHQ